MNAIDKKPAPFAGAEPSLLDIVRAIGPDFAARAAAADADAFVAENFAALKAHRLFAAAVPAELGGGGASPEDMAGAVRALARHCGSTALAFSMHTHVVAVAAWRWANDKAPLEPMLRKVAAEQTAFVSTGGGDWLVSQGRASRVEGGFKIEARKAFASGSPAGDMLNTSAVYDDPAAGPTVLHFGVPLKGPNVRIEQNWAALGMRGTGSHDIVLDGVFVPDAAIGGKRPQGQWHRLFHLISMIALPIIYATYVGVAEAARDRAVELAAPRKADRDTQLLAGELENALAIARYGFAEMMAVTKLQPGPETTNRALIARTVVGRACLDAASKAMALAGGRAMYRTSGLERMFRDIQGAVYHPVQEKPQQRLSGRLALGLGIDE